MIKPSGDSSAATTRMLIDAKQPRERGGARRSARAARGAVTAGPARRSACAAARAGTRSSQVSPACWSSEAAGWSLPRVTTLMTAGFDL